MVTYENKKTILNESYMTKLNVWKRRILRTMYGPLIEPGELEIIRNIGTALRSRYIGIHQKEKVLLAGIYDKNG